MVREFEDGLPDGHDITTAQLAVDGQVEEGEVAHSPL